METKNTKANVRFGMIFGGEGRDGEGSDTMLMFSFTWVRGLPMRQKSFGQGRRSSEIPRWQCVRE